MTNRRISNTVILDDQIWRDLLHSYWKDTGSGLDSQAVQPTISHRYVHFWAYDHGLPRNQDRETDHLFGKTQCSAGVTPLLLSVMDYVPYWLESQLWRVPAIGILIFGPWSFNARWQGSRLIGKMPAFFYSLCRPQVAYGATLKGPSQHPLKTRQQSESKPKGYMTGLSNPR